MEIWRPRSLERQLRAILSSSLSSPLSLPKPRSFKSFYPLSPFSHNPHRRFFPASLIRPPSGGCRFILHLLFRPYTAYTANTSSSLSLGQGSDWKDHQQHHSASEEENYHNHLLEVQQEKQGRFIPVKAYFLCTSIDLRSLQAQNAVNVIPPSSRATNYVVLRYYDFKEDQVMELDSLNESKCHYMVVFQYGSVVLFNVSEHEVDEYLKVVQKHASGLLPEMRKDDYAVVEKPTLDAWMEGGFDYITLKNLSIDGIRTIGSVLGQSIALDYYIRQVDGMVAEFTDINRGLEKTGTFTMQRKKLFQLVGKANSNMADVILKLGLFERTDIAWKSAIYAQIWEYLREEYELSQRFGNLDFKLKFVEVVSAAKKFRYAGIPSELEERLRRMFDSVIACGRHATTPDLRSNPPESTDERALSGGENDIQEDNVAPPPPEVTSARKRKKGKRSATSSVLEDLAESSKTISRCIQEHPKSNPYTITQALERLSGYPDIVADEKFYDFAITFLLDKGHREAFMFLPEGMNIKWLYNRYNGGG